MATRSAASKDPASGKADFSAVYNRPDPRGYFAALRSLEYQIPANAIGVFSDLLRAQAGTPGRQATRAVLDLCCSYGINAALLGFEVSLPEMYDHYHDPDLIGLDTEQVASADAGFFRARKRADAPRMLGLDVAENAVDYARRVGLLDEGWWDNLESAHPSPGLAREVADVGLVSITGGVGYVTERTFGRLATCFGEQSPWVAAFVLRMYPYDAIASTLAEHGLETELLPGVTFRQRRFASTEEQDAALRELHARGVDTAGKEDDGWYHCDFFLSRPRPEAEGVPLSELLPAWSD